eukprot:m.147534 g.147534  ORF g.147534 m.147534 type:complete len:112 (+) comp10104_c1_seq8:994-1329(+)
MCLTLSLTANNASTCFPSPRFSPAELESSRRSQSPSSNSHHGHSSTQHRSMSREPSEHGGKMLHRSRPSPPAPYLPSASSSSSHSGRHHDRSSRQQGSRDAGYHSSSRHGR